MRNIDEHYRPPTANLEHRVENEIELASRGKRFFAAMIDGIIGIVVSTPLIIYLGVWEAAADGREAPLEVMLILSGFGLVSFLAIHGYFLKKHGQTVGKKLLNLYIVDMNHQIPDFTRLISLRYLPLWAVGYIPIIGSFLPTLDVLFIFRKDKRCIHDLLAGTKVISR